jgi:HEAT repeat protein
MGEIEIEIPDSPIPPSPAGRRPGEGAFRRRMPVVPLIVIPGALVLCAVGIFVLFGLLTGEEASPRDNIERLLHGGANQRQQAAFQLVRQALESWEERAGELDESWVVDRSLLPELRAAHERCAAIESPEDVPIPLALGILRARLGDPGGVAELIEMLGLAGDLDPEARYRGFAGFALGAMGEGLSAEQRAGAASALIELMGGDEPFLREVAVIALQTLPGPETVPALRGALDASSVGTRLNAALSLARLGEDSGRSVLLEMIHPEPYRAEHRLDRRKWARETRITESRLEALRCLERLGAPPGREVLEGLAREDPDARIRELAMRMLGER